MDINDLDIQSSNRDMGATIHALDAAFAEMLSEEENDSNPVSSYSNPYNSFEQDFYNLLDI